MRAGRATGVLLAALAVSLSAWPGITASPVPSGPSAAPFVPVELPLAPPGWVFATRASLDGEDDRSIRLEVLTASPAGEVRTIATLPDVFAGLTYRHGLSDEHDPILGPDGRLLVPFWQEPGEGSDAHDHLRVLDLTLADPFASAVDLDLGPDGGWSAWAAFAADGRLAVRLPYEDGSWSTMLVLEPGATAFDQVPIEAPAIAAWLADFTGWGSWQGHSTTDLAGVVSESVPPVPLLDLAYGAQQRSADGLVLQTYDIGAIGAPVANSPVVLAMRNGPTDPCEYDWWVAGKRDARDGRTIVWDDCASGRLLDIRWDVDGRDVLELYRRGRGVRLVRREIAGATTELARFPASDLEPAPGPVRFLRVYVDGLVAGPRPDELLLAMRASQRGSGIAGSVLTFLSTFDLLPVHLDDARFAGFSSAPVPAATAVP